MLEIVQKTPKTKSNVRRIGKTIKYRGKKEKREGNHTKLLKRVVEQECCPVLDGQRSIREKQLSWSRLFWSLATLSPMSSTSSRMLMVFL